MTLHTSAAKALQGDIHQENGHSVDEVPLSRRIEEEFFLNRMREVKQFGHVQIRNAIFTAYEHNLCTVTDAINRLGEEDLLPDGETPEGQEEFLRIFIAGTRALAAQRALTPLVAPIENQWDRFEERSDDDWPAPMSWPDIENTFQSEEVI
jgi:hypothetical protein